MTLRPTRSNAPITLSIIGGIFGIGVGMWLAFFGTVMADLVNEAAEGIEELGSLAGIADFLPAIGWVTLFGSILAIVGGSLAKRTPAGGFVLAASGIAVFVCEIVLCSKCQLFELASYSSAFGVLIFALLIPGLLMLIGAIVAVCAAFMKEKTPKASIPPQAPVPPQAQ